MEAAIAIFFKEGFIRHTFGDFLVVILLYCLFKSFIRGNELPIALATLGIAFVIEFLQLTDFLKIVGLEHSKWAALVFGNSFSVQDLVAYTLGILTVIILEKVGTLNQSFPST
jgi:hypothetical protein